MLGSAPSDYYEAGARDDAGRYDARADGGDPYHSHRSKRAKTDELLYGKQYVAQAVDIMAHLHSALITHNPANARVHTTLVSHAGDLATDSTASQRVLNARRALGADDEAYLSTGIMLLWAGDGDRDEEVDEQLMLYPTSDRSLGRQAEGPAKGWVAAMDIEMRGRTDHAHALLGEVAGALAVLIKLPGVNQYLRETVQMAGLASDENGKGLVAAICAGSEVDTEALRVCLLQESTRMSASSGEAVVQGTRNLMVVADALADLWTADNNDPDAPNAAMQGAATFVKELVDELPLLSARNARTEDAALLRATYLSGGDLEKAIIEEACSANRLRKSMEDTKKNQEGRQGTGPNTDHERSIPVLANSTLDDLSKKLEHTRIENTYAEMRAQQDSMDAVYGEKLNNRYSHRGIDAGVELSLKHRRLLQWDEEARTAWNEKQERNEPTHLSKLLSREKWEARSDITLHFRLYAQPVLASGASRSEGESLAEHHLFKPHDGWSALYPGQYRGTGPAYRGVGDRESASIQGSAARLLLPPVQDFSETYQLAESDTLRCTLGRTDFDSVAMKTFQTINAGIAAGAATFNAVTAAKKWTETLRVTLGVDLLNGGMVQRSAAGYSGTERLRSLSSRLPAGLRRRSAPIVSQSPGTPMIDRAITTMRRTLVSRECTSRRGVLLGADGKRVLSKGLQHFDQAIWAPVAPLHQTHRGPVGDPAMTQYNPDVSDWAGYGRDTDAALEMVRLFYIDALSNMFSTTGSTAHSSDAHDVMGVHTSSIAASAMRAGVQIAKMDALQRLQKMPATSMRRVYENALYSIDTPLDRQRVRVRIFFEPLEGGHLDEIAAVAGESEEVTPNGATQLASRELIARLDPGAEVVYSYGVEEDLAWSMPVEGTSVQPALPSVGVVQQKYDRGPIPTDGPQVPYAVRKQLSLQPGEEYDSTSSGYHMQKSRWTALYPQRYSLDNTDLQSNNDKLGSNLDWNFESAEGVDAHTWPDEREFRVVNDDNALPSAFTSTTQFARAMLTEFVTAMDWNAVDATSVVKRHIRLVLGMDVEISRPVVQVVPHVLGTRFVGVPGKTTYDINSTDGDQTQNAFLSSLGSLSVAQNAERQYEWPEGNTGLHANLAVSERVRQMMGLISPPGNITWPTEWPPGPPWSDGTTNPARAEDNVVERVTKLEKVAIASALAFAIADPQQGAGHSGAGVTKSTVYQGFASQGFGSGDFVGEYNRWKLGGRVQNQNRRDIEERSDSRHNPNYKPPGKVTPMYRQLDVMIHLKPIANDILEMRPLLLIPRWNLDEGARDFVAQLKVVLNTQRILQMYGTAVCCVDPSVADATARWTLARTRTQAETLFANADEEANRATRADAIYSRSTWDGDPHSRIGRAWHRKRRGKLGGHYPDGAFPDGHIDLLTNRRFGTDRPARPGGQTYALSHPNARIETPRARLVYARNSDDGNLRPHSDSPLRDDANELIPEASMVGILLLVRRNSPQETAADISRRVAEILGLPRSDSVRIWHSEPPSPTQAALGGSQRVRLFGDDIDREVASDGHQQYPLDCPMTIACVDVLAEPSALPVPNGMDKMRLMKKQHEWHKQKKRNALAKANQSQYPDSRGRWAGATTTDRNGGDTLSYDADDFNPPDHPLRSSLTTSDEEYTRKLFLTTVRPFYAPMRKESANGAYTPLLQSLAAPMGPEAGIIDAMSDSRVANKLYDSEADVDQKDGSLQQSGIRFLMQYAAHERAGRDIMLHSALAKKAHQQLIVAVKNAIEHVVAAENGLTSDSRDLDVTPDDSELELSSRLLLNALVTYMQTADSDAFSRALRLSDNGNVLLQSKHSQRIASWAVAISRSPIVQAVAAAVARVPTHNRLAEESWEFDHTIQDAWVSESTKGAPFVVGVADGLLYDTATKALYREARLNPRAKAPNINRLHMYLGAGENNAGYRVFDDSAFQLTGANSDGLEEVPSEFQDNPNFDRESLIRFRNAGKRTSVFGEREDIWKQLEEADYAIQEVLHSKNRLPEWMSSEGMREIAVAARDAATMLSSAARWRSNSDEIRHELQRVAEDRSTRKQAERQRRSSLWLDAMRELSITNDRLYIFLRTLAGTLHESIDAVIEVNDSSVQRAQEQERSRRTEALRKANDFSNRVMQTVFSAALKSAKLDFGLSGSEIVVLSQANVEEVRRLAEGESGVGYFEAAQQLQQAVNSPQGVPLERMMQSVAAVLQELRQQQVNAVDEQTSDVLRSSFEYLSAPRNSFTVRLKAEASAAIRTAWSTFCVEWAQKATGRTRRPSAWELIEGPDNVLRTTFATYCAYQLSHSRIFSSSSAVYVSRTSSQTNFSMMRVTLFKLINRACEYVHANPMPPNYSMSYRQNSAFERNPWGQIPGGVVDASGMASAGVARQVAPRYAYGVASGGIGGYGAPDWADY